MASFPDIVLATDLLQRYGFTTAELQLDYPRIVYGSKAPTDVAPPVVTVVGPPITTAIVASTALAFTVTDDVALRRVMVVARLAQLGLEEVVHQGDRFAVLYAGASTRMPIAGGYSYSVLRNGGWPADVTIDVYSIDTAGNEALDAPFI